MGPSIYLTFVIFVYYLLHNDIFILPDYIILIFQIVKSGQKNDSLIFTGWLQQHWKQNFMSLTQKTKKTVL